jgi:hypothetical protein
MTYRHEGQYEINEGIKHRFDHQEKLKYTGFGQVGGICERR